MLNEEIYAKVKPIQAFGDQNGDTKDICSFYQFIVDKAPRGARLVEVGNFCGRGLAYLALAAKAADKDLKVLGCDWGRGMSGNCEWPTPNAVLTNLHHLGVSDTITLYNRSHLVADWIADESIWFVFIDDGHEEEDVRLSCKAWYPKVQKGGIFAGHDYQWPGVNKTVRDWYPWAHVFEYGSTRDTFWFEKK